MYQVTNKTAPLTFSGSFEKISHGYPTNFSQFNYHKLLIAKLNAYDFSEPSLKLIYEYLKNRLQHIKINLSFSEWSELIQGVSQGSVLGLLLFNIYLNDLFYILNDVDICNYADDTTPNVCDSSLKVVIEKLEKAK